MRVRLGGQHGGFALVDDCDKSLIAGFSWHQTTKGYVMGSKPRGDGTYQRIYLHRLLMGNGNHEVDHINGNKLDNRRRNLRTCSRRENSTNRHEKYNSYGRGIYKTPSGRYRIQCYFYGKKIDGGSYIRLSDARAAIRQLRKRFGYIRT